MYENWKVAQEKLRTPSPPAGSESCEAEHTESEEDPVWLYPGDDGWHEAAPIFVIGYRDEETDEETDEEDSEAPWIRSGGGGALTGVALLAHRYGTDEDDIREMEAAYDEEVRANEELYDATD